MVKTVNGIETEMEQEEIAEYEASLPTQEQITANAIKAKIAEGEAYITKTILDMVTTLNVNYGVNYKDIYAVGLYGNSSTYPLATQCKAVWDWNELMWATARLNQPSVLDGTMTDAEFLASLPVAPVV